MVSGAGSLVVQRPRRADATIIGIAGEANADWLRSMGAELVGYDEGLTE